MSEHLPESFADEYLPVYDISDAVAVVVEAERETVMISTSGTQFLRCISTSLRSGRRFACPRRGQ